MLIDSRIGCKTTYFSRQVNDKMIILFLNRKPFHTPKKFGCACDFHRLYDVTHANTNLFFPFGIQEDKFRDNRILVRVLVPPTNVTMFA